MRTHRHTHSCTHGGARRRHRPGGKSLKCRSQALWSALVVITWWWMWGWSNERPCSLPLTRPSLPLSPPPLLPAVALRLWHPVCRLLRLSGGPRENGEMKKGGRERVVVLCSHLIKDHFGRHRLRGVECVFVCVCLWTPARYGKVRVPREKIHESSLRANSRGKAC